MVFDGKEVSSSHRKSLEAHRAEKTARHHKELEKQIAHDQKKYETALNLHFKLNTSASWSRVNTVDEEMNKLTSETQQLKAVKEQINIWYLGAGWKDCKRAWSKKKKKYHSSQLVGELKGIIKNHVVTGRKIRASVTEPLSITKGRIQLGTTACDVLEMDEKDAEEESKLVDLIYEKCGLTRSPDSMPEPESLVGKRIKFMYVYGENGKEEDLTWCFGKVLDVETNDEAIIADIEWDDEFVTDPDEKVMIEELEFENWARRDDTLREGSWQLL